MERSFFETVLDALEGFVSPDHGELHARTHRRGIKVWFGDAIREHYEAQLIPGTLLDRDRDDVGFEIGVHLEHPKVQQNEERLAKLVEAEARWRPELGDEATAGLFLGGGSWRRISEVWEPPDPEDPEATIEVAARMADYIDAIEPIRRGLTVT